MYYVTEARRQTLLSQFRSYDYLGGFNSVEGSLLLPYLEKVTRADNTDINQGINRTTVATILNDFTQTYVPSNPEAVKSTLRSFYFSEGELSSRATPLQAAKIVELYTDLMFAAPTLVFLDAHSEGRTEGGGTMNRRGSTYMYIFTHETSDSQQINPTWYDRQSDLTVDV